MTPLFSLQGLSLSEPFWLDTSPAYWSSFLLGSSSFPVMVFLCSQFTRTSHFETGGVFTELFHRFIQDTVQTGSWFPPKTAIQGHILSETYKRKCNHTFSGTSWVCSISILSKTYHLELMTYFSNFYPQASLSERGGKAT